MTENAPDDIAAMSFEQALAELEQIVRQLEAGSGHLEDAINSYDRGDRLRRHCEAKLREAKARVELISQGRDGAVATEPAQID